MTGPSWHPEYPPEDRPFLAHFEARYEAALVALHPFFELTRAEPSPPLREYPSVRMISEQATPIRWSGICERTAIPSLEILHLALLTSISAVQPEFAVPAEAGRLHTYLESHAIWPPGEGQIEPLLLGSFATVLAAEGHRELLARDEFGQSCSALPLAATERENRALLESCDFVVTSVSAPDDSLLAIVHWDSFFTLLLGARPAADRIEQSGQLEGFRCASDTTHLWWFEDRAS